MADNPTLHVTIDCAGMAPPRVDANDTQRILDAVLAAFVDPDPGDVVNVTIDFVNGQRSPESTLTGPWIAARVFDEGDHWTIDLVNERGDYSEFVWDHYIEAGAAELPPDLRRPDGREGNFDTMRQALKRVPEFIAEHHADDTVRVILVTGVLSEDIRIELPTAEHPVDFRVFPADHPPAFLPTLANAINYVSQNFQALECPNCGHADKFQVLEEQTLSWDVRVIDGKLVNETGSEVSDAPGQNERMYCGACGNDFPMFKDVKVEYP